MSRADTAIRAATGVTVVGLAGVAGAISYSHMTELAHLHGETGWRGHMFPLSVDGIEIVASLVLLADKRSGRRPGPLPWVALIAGTGASLAANVAVGGADLIGRAVAGWPAFALLVAVKLLFGQLHHQPDLVTADPDRPTNGRAGWRSAPVPDGSDQTPEASSAVPDGPPRATPVRDDLPPVPDGQPPVHLASDSFGGSDRLDDLLPAARAAQAAIANDGRRVTREALAKRMRGDGHAVSNARVSALLRALSTDGVAGRAGCELVRAGPQARSL